jgi:hypothetical protein
VVEHLSRIGKALVLKSKKKKKKKRMMMRRRRRKSGRKGRGEKTPFLPPRSADPCSRNVFPTN